MALASTSAQAQPVAKTPAQLEAEQRRDAEDWRLLELEARMGKPVLCPPRLHDDPIRTYSPGAPPGSVCGPRKKPSDITKLPPLPQAPAGGGKPVGAGSPGGAGADTQPSSSSAPPRRTSGVGKRFASRFDAEANARDRAIYWIPKGRTLLRTEIVPKSCMFWESSQKWQCQAWAYYQ